MRYEAGFGRECIFLIFGSVVQITGIERENVSTFHTGRCGEPDRSLTSFRAGHVGGICFVSSAAATCFLMLAGSRGWVAADCYRIIIYHYPRVYGYKLLR